MNNTLETLQEKITDEKDVLFSLFQVGMFHRMELLQFRGFCSYTANN